MSLNLRPFLLALSILTNQTELEVFFFFSFFGEQRLEVDVKDLPKLTSNPKKKKDKKKDPTSLIDTIDASH